MENPSQSMELRLPVTTSPRLAREARFRPTIEFSGGQHPLPATGGENSKATA